MSVPFLDLGTEFASVEAEWLAAVREAGQRGQFILGANVTAFEQEVAAYLGVEHAVSVASGTDALVLSLRALGVGAGDEVITTPFTFFATAEAIALVGATPVFADIDANTFTLDPDSVAARITPRTRALIPVHLFGCPAAMGALLQLAAAHDLVIVEDAAQAFGAADKDSRVGSIGQTGCFSFYPTKVLGAYGDGGLVSTRDAALDAHLRKLRNHGATAPFVHDEVGTNSRLDEVQAALLRIKLRSIDAAIAQRQAVARRYTERLATLPLVTPLAPAGARHVFNLYTVRVANRDAVRARLDERGIASAVCYPRPLHLQDVHAGLGYSAGDLPVAEQAAGEVLSLPVFPGMSESQVDEVCAALQR